MIVDPEHDRIAELLGAYALDAVDPDESSLVELHLAECSQCRRDVDGLREAAADMAIAEGLDADGPPPALWGRIAAGAGIDVSARDPGSIPATARAGVVRQGPARWWTGTRAAWIGAAVAAAVALAVLSVGLVQAQGQVHRLQTALATRGARAAVHAALVSPGHQLTDLRSSDGTVLAEFVVRRNGVGYVVGSTMAKLPVTQTYQLWASVNGQAISLGLLGRKPASGTGFSLGTSATSARELMVTVEPSGGVPTPDRTPIATAPLA